MIHNDDARDCQRYVMGKYKYKKKPKGYWQRNKILAKMGFSDYADYLNSALWKSIRSKILKQYEHKCYFCKEYAILVHHVLYTKRTLQGKDLRFLVPLCDKCHTELEFDSDGNKLPLAKVYDLFREKQTTKMRKKYADKKARKLARRAARK